MIETPLAAQAAGCLYHAPRGYQEGEKLPMRAVQVVYVRETGQAQTGCECAQRKQRGAQQRFLPQPEDVGAKAHHLSLYRDGGESRCAPQESNALRRAIPGPGLRAGWPRGSGVLHIGAIPVIHSLCPVPGSPKIPTSHWAHEEA